MVLILSDWYFYAGWEKILSGIRFSAIFDNISSLLDTIFVYQELIKVEGFDAFAITLFVFNDDITEEISNE